MNLINHNTVIAIFAYNRPSHLRRLLISLENMNIKRAYVFLDGPKNFEEKIIQKDIITMVKYNKFMKLRMIKKKKKYWISKINNFRNYLSVIKI